jgi:hypothetical protein
MLIDGLHRYDRASLLRGAAALSLWPLNADRHVALKELVDALAEARDGRANACQVGARDWRKWLASRESAALRAIQPAGIYDAPLCVETALLGERVGLIGGDLEYPDLQYRLWIDAVASAEETAPDPELAQARQVLIAGARISDRLIRVAQLGSYRWPNHGLSLKLRAPEDDEYDQLCEAITVPTAEIRELDLDRASVAALTRDGETRWRPLAETQEGVIVADPWRLTLSALVHAAAFVGASSRRLVVKERLLASTLRELARVAHDMDWRVERVDDRCLLAHADLDCTMLLACDTCLAGGGDMGMYLDDPPGLGESRARAAAVARANGADHCLLALVTDGRAIMVGRDHESVGRAGPEQPWLLSIGDLRLIGDALRRDPLALPSALERIPRGPWAENIDLVDWVGAVRRQDEPFVHRGNVPLDGTEHLQMRARIMAGRHPARRSDGGGWCEVSRWSGSPDPALYSAESAAGFQLLVRAPGVYLWVGSAEPAAGRDHLSGALAMTLAFWFARFFDAVMLVGPRELHARFVVELSDAAGPALAVAASASSCRLIAGPAFAELACRGNNDADRMLLAAALSCLGFEPFPLVDTVAPAGRGTFMIWPDPATRVHPPRHEPPPLVTARDRAAVESALASTVVPEGDEVAVVAGRDVRPAVLDLLARLDDLIAAGVTMLDASSIVALVGLHEAAVWQSESEEIGLPARDALSAGEELDRDYLGSRESMGARNVALRALIERATAAPPSGDRMLSRRLAASLRAAVELEVRLGSAADFAAGGYVRARLAIGQAVGIAINLEGALPRAGERMVEELERSAPTLMASQHSEWCSTPSHLPAELVLDEPILLEDPKWVKLDLVIERDWGVRLEQLVRVLATLSELAEDHEAGVATSSRADLVAALAARTAIPVDTLGPAVDLLILGPVSDYAALSREHAPWRAFRERSYLRCPLVLQSDGDLVWSSLHVRSAARYLLELIDRGRLRGSPALVRAVGEISGDADRQFELAALRRAKDAGWAGRSRVKRLGGLKLEREPGQSIGDVDVLCWSHSYREVWLLECKRLAPGLNAHVSARERDVLTRCVEHHCERLAWVRSRGERLAREVGDADAQHWAVNAAIVLDRPLMGAYVTPFALPIWTMWELPGKLEEPRAR